MKSIVSTIIYQFSDRKKKVIDHRKHSMIAASICISLNQHTKPKSYLYIYMVFHKLL